jgi:hypothetical protein
MPAINELLTNNGRLLVESAAALPQRNTAIKTLSLNGSGNISLTIPAAGPGLFNDILAVYVSMYGIPANTLSDIALRDNNAIVYVWRFNPGSAGVNCWDGKMEPKEPILQMAANLPWTVSFGAGPATGGTILVQYLVR